MPDLPPLIFNAVVSLNILVLFAAGVLELYVLIRGFLVARDNRLRGLVRDERAILLKSPLALPVSVVLVAPDASETTRRMVDSLNKLHYGDHEVLVVLDEPSDDDLAVWMMEYRLFPSTRSSTGNIPAKTIRAVYESHDPVRMMVIEKDRGGYADCLNVAVNLSGAPLLGVAEMGAEISHDVLLRTVRPFLETPELTLASTALVPPVVSSTSLERYFTLEGLREWFTLRLGLSAWNVTLPSPGSFILLKRSAITEVKGFHSGPFELMVHIHALYRALGKPYRIGLVQDSVATQVPPRSWSELHAIGDKWQRDVLSAATRHFPLMFGFGGLGWLALPGMFWTRAAGPVVEMAGFALTAVGLALGWVGWPVAALLVITTVVMGILKSMTVVVLREFVTDEPLPPRRLTELFLASVPENLLFRMQRNLWLIAGVFRRSPK